MVKDYTVAMEEFLKLCEESGDSAYNAFKAILEKLENPSTRSETRVFLASLQRRFESKESSLKCFSDYHFRIHDVLLANEEGQNRKKLTMMEIPSIFIPEDWSFTFYEGINRHPDSIFRDKTVAELGCGNGWISIALAEKWCPSKVYGLDINPRAIKVAWINLYLNALDENGLPIYDQDKKTLLDRVEFHESDLLAYCRDHSIILDRIVGCIPQILNPNPEAMSKMITENASEEFLYSLSNYCALQGFFEDQFGLGLIARAVEEGIEVIQPMGFMIFNIGGRPGQAVCKRLFERRGFRITKLWQTKVIQAADTDISALVEIEKNSHHRFEFFMGLAGDQPICARTAWAYGKAGGRISHSLSVYSCELRQPNQVKKIFDFLKNGFQEVSGALDLSFDDDSVADEKIPFLAYLASILKENSSFPYEPPAGSTRFRNLIASFMRIYHHIPLDINNVVVFPSRAVAIENALRLFSPRLAIVDEHLTGHLPKQWLTSLAIEGNESTEDMLTVLQAPRQSDLLIELIKKLKPQVVVTGMAKFEVITSSSFEQLLEATREIGCRLFLDISDHLELSSLPAINGVLKYLAGNILPPHAAILCGLVKNQVYSDLEVAFVISEEENLFSALSKTVELLQGHTAVSSQYYYGCLFHELLAFQLADRHPPAQREPAKETSMKMIGFASSAMSTLNDPELSTPLPPIDKNNSGPNDPVIIHMDMDQNCLPTPSAVRAAIFESFARQNMTDAETDVGPGIRDLISSKYGLPLTGPSEIIYADSPLALFTKLVLCCIQEGGTLCIPFGSNGNYILTAKFLKANVSTIPTLPDNGFKLTENILKGFLPGVKRPWVYLSGPTVNPTGSIYTKEEIEGVLSICSTDGARLVMDTSFSGLEWKRETWGGWDLGKVGSELCLSVLGGLSFDVLTRGLDFGFLVLNNADVIELFHGFPGLSQPHGTVRYAVKKLLDMREHKAEVLAEAVAEHKKTLESRAAKLRETLERCGWDVVDCHGGVSMVAKPSAYIGKPLMLNKFHEETCLTESNIREAILKTTGLSINSASWTGIPAHCRFTMALEENEFKQALERIQNFKEIVLGS
ncbi:hypothetical protein AMTRI_Chr11g158820 [Amborella trichopoda]|uniref:methionine S-methyltransferase n=1 Tax=Amborella trichopoda TaxID=13333 RepID=UPI0005D2F04F|nr:methionine S-methyltransferase [Amborella trichopoda]|eukprot:XP_011621019.1 methionine S-methyltransferase [Amborella trichopoda]